MKINPLAVWQYVVVGTRKSVHGCCKNVDCSCPPGSKFLAKILNDARAKILGKFLPHDLDKNYQDVSLIKVLGRLRARERARNAQENAQGIRKSSP